MIRGFEYLTLNLLKIVYFVFYCQILTDGHYISYGTSSYINLYVKNDKFSDLKYSTYSDHLSKFNIYKLILLFTKFSTNLKYPDPLLRIPKIIPISVLLELLILISCYYIT